MKFLVKIDKKKKYIRITIPTKVVEITKLNECDLAEIRVTGDKKIEVEGIELKKGKGIRVQRDIFRSDS